MTYATTLLRSSEDVETSRHEIGFEFCTHLSAILQQADVFGPDHQQTHEEARTLVDWLERRLGELGEERLVLHFSNERPYLNQQVLKLRYRRYARVAEMRSTLVERKCNELELERGTGAHEILKFTDVLLEGSDPLYQFQTLHIDARFHAEHASSDEEQDASTSRRREMFELYAGLLVRCREYIGAIERETSPTGKNLKRIIQKITDLIEAHGDVLVGLIRLGPLDEGVFLHLANRCVYTMLLAKGLELTREEIAEVGLTSITYDLAEHIQGDEESEIDHLGDESHFTSNLASTQLVSQLGMRGMVSLQRIVTSFEQGFPHDSVLPSAWYRDELTPHVASRIIEIARDYDVLTQGLQGREAMPSDVALEAILNDPTDHYDPDLARVFAAEIGIYPVGSVVALSTGNRALVVRSATTSEIEAGHTDNFGRPTVRLLDGSGDVLDLSRPEHRDVRILRLVEQDELEETPSAMLLF